MPCRVALTVWKRSRSAHENARIATLAFYKGAPNHWTEELIMANVLGKSKEYPGSRAYDPESIMNYAFSPELFVPGKETRPGNDLSKSDKRYVASLYPPE